MNWLQNEYPRRLPSVIITIFNRVRTALDLAADADLSGRIEVWDIQQFLSTNINEHSLFDGTARNVKLAEIIGKS